MDKQGKLIGGCAAVGLLVAAFFFIFVGILGIVDGTLYTAMLVLWPPSLLSIPFSEAMRDKSGFYAVCLLIGFLNSGLYGANRSCNRGASDGRVTDGSCLLL